MEKILKVGIVGCGNISHSHMAAYRKNKNIEVVACADINRQRAIDYAEVYKIPNAYGSIDEMLEKQTDLDAVSVCTWNNGHHECTMKALKAKKHVLCEKPMAMNAKEAIEMQEEAKKQGKVLQVGFVKRFAKTTRVFQDFAETGTFGDIYLTKAIYTRRVGNPGGWFADKKRSGGGPLIDLGVHVIDLSRYLMGMHKPVSVYGATFKKLGAKNDTKGISRYFARDYDPNGICDVEDSAIALIRFDNGSVLHVETSFTLNLKEGITTLQMFGDKGGAVVEPNLEIYKDINHYMTNITPIVSYDYDVFGEMFGNQINHFYDCCTDETVVCKAPAEDGVVLMKILDAIYESALTGNEVKID